MHAQQMRAHLDIQTLTYMQTCIGTAEFQSNHNNGFKPEQCIPTSYLPYRSACVHAYVHAEVIAYIIHTGKNKKVHFIHN